MIAARLAKGAAVLSVALLAGLIAYGNVADYGTNYAFVQHVLSMDTIFPDATTRWRAITDPAMHRAAYAAIIATEALAALLCGIGGLILLARLRADARSFNRAKATAIAGLTLWFLLMQVGFMAIGGEWFGMWMSQTWNGQNGAFRFMITAIGVLIFLALPDGEPERD